MGFDNRGLLIWRSFFLRLAQLFDETHGTTLKSTLEPPSCAGMNEVDKLSDHSAVHHRSASEFGVKKDKIKDYEARTSSLSMSRSFSSSIPRYENVRNVLLFFISAA
jgi:hypothetical protein